MDNTRKFFYTTHEGGYWKEMKTDLTQEEIASFMKNGKDGKTFTWLGNPIHSVKNAEGVVFFDRAFGGPRPV